MATHSNRLAWKIPGTEEPGGLQFMGSQESDMTARTQSCPFYRQENRKTGVLYERFYITLVVPLISAQKELASLMIVSGPGVKLAYPIGCALVVELKEIRTEQCSQPENLEIRLPNESLMF